MMSWSGPCQGTSRAPPERSQVPRIVQSLLRLTQERPHRERKVALARKLAVVLHRLWRDGTAFVPA